DDDRRLPEADLRDVHGAPQLTAAWVGRAVGRAARRPASFRMNFGRKYEIITGSSVSDATKLTNIQIARRPPITASKRMLENVQSAVPPTMQTAVKLTALPDVTSASRMERSRSPLTRISSMMRERM